jgi:hypothetical protein
MFRKLVKTSNVEVDEQCFSVRYYEARTMRGARRYSSEIILGPRDRIILDDDSMNSLESKVVRLVPATLYSRMLAGRATVAA